MQQSNSRKTASETQRGLRCAPLEGEGKGSRLTIPVLSVVQCCKNRLETARGNEKTQWTSEQRLDIRC